MQEIMKNSIISILGVAAALCLPSCAKFEVIKSELEKLDNTVWVETQEQNEVAMFCEDGEGLFLTYSPKFQSFACVDGKYEYRNPDVTITIEGESRNGVVSETGKNLSFYSDDAVVRFARLVSTTTSLASTSWVSTGLIGSTITVTFSADTFVMTQTMVVPDPKPVSATGKYGYANPVFVLEGKDEKGNPESLFGFVNADGSQLIMIGDTGDSILFVRGS